MILEKLLHEEDYKKLLENRFNNPNLKIKSIEYKPLSENVEGYMGEHYKLTVFYDDNGKNLSANFFVKTKPNDEFRSKISEENKVFKKEIFFYDFLLREFSKYGLDVSFAAKCYYCIPDKVLIMEDLSERGFKLAERQTFFSKEQVKCLLKSLALYHGAGFAYETKQSKELGRQYNIFEEYSSFFEENFFTLYTSGEGFSNDFLKASISSIIKLIDLMDRSEGYKNQFKQLVDKTEIGKIFSNQSSELTKICTHGDLWSNNLMFNFLENSVKSCCLLDFQVIRYFYPAFDVLLAVHFNTDHTFIEKNYYELYTYYYSTLTEVLFKYNVIIDDVLSKEDFYKALNLVEVEAMVQVLSINIVTFLPAITLNETSKNSLKSNDDIKNKIDNFATDVSHVAYRTDEKYRKIIDKNLERLYEVLLKKYM